ncbi:MAG: hypothetical protein AB7V44_31315, partial [Pseudonocardia sp.]
MTVARPAPSAAISTDVDGQLAHARPDPGRGRADEPARRRADGHRAAHDERGRGPRGAVQPDAGGVERHGGRGGDRS